MRNGFLALAGLVLLAGCSMQVPGFLGRDGNGSNTYSRKAAASPDPVEVPLKSALVEPGLYGVILRAEAVTPTQGYYKAVLGPMSQGVPDAAGIVGIEMTAFPPTGAQDVGPERTRTLRAALFFPTLALKDVKGFRVKGGPNVVTVPLR
ncbi:MAG: hypothetical protein U1E34_09610 [Amaricoccus sp.]